MSDANEPPTDDIKIHNWLDVADEEKISPDTRLVRYMKLETFLLLLDGLVFVPTLKTLQNADRNEAILPLLWTPFYEEKMRPIVMPHKEWLFETAGHPTMRVLDEAYRDISDLCLATQCWRFALATRRCVWCWNRASEHFHFMWKTYGDRGVAIFSTVGKIRKVLSASGAQGIVSTVRYVPLADSVPRPEYAALKTYFHRPHLFKDSGYKPENEVRFVLQVDPNQLNVGGTGRTVNIDPRAIIDRLEVSPHLFSDEQQTIYQLNSKRLRPSIPLPEWPPLMERFSAEQELPAGLFTDLDFPDDA
jgi:hypothetical protein